MLLLLLPLLLLLLLLLLLDRLLLLLLPKAGSSSSQLCQAGFQIRPPFSDRNCSRSNPNSSAPVFYLSKATVYCRRMFTLRRYHLPRLPVGSPSMRFSKNQP